MKLASASLKAMSLDNLLFYSEPIMLNLSRSWSAELLKNASLRFNQQGRDDFASFAGQDVVGAAGRSGIHGFNADALRHE